MKPASAFLVSATVLFASASARADDGVARAHTAFQQGLDRMKAGSPQQACPLFAEAHRLDPKLGYVVNLARCETKLGHFVAAEQLWREAHAVAEQTHDDRQAEVDRGLEAAQRDLPRIEVELPPGSDARVSIDDRAASADEIATGVPVDPGAHAIVVSGRPARSFAIRIKGAGERLHLAVPAASPPSPPSLGASRVSSESSTASDSHRGDSLRIAAIAIGSAGIAAAGLGTFAVLRAQMKNDETTKLCPDNMCPTDEGFRLRNEASALADLATVAFVAGGALVTSGLVLWLVSPRGSVERRAFIAPHLGGASLQGTF